MYIYRKWELFQTIKLSLSSGNESRGEETKLDNSQCTMLNIEDLSGLNTEDLTEICGFHNKWWNPQIN